MTNPSNKRSHLNVQDLLMRSEAQQDGCILWAKAKSPAGYGLVSLSGKLYSVHRYILTITKGAPSQGQQALHSCDTPSCINPDHLRWGTHAENAMDKAVRIRGTNKLSVEAVKEIRSMAANGNSLTKIAGIFGVSRSTVSHIVLGYTWTHIK